MALMNGRWRRFDVLAKGNPDELGVHLDPS